MKSGLFNGLIVGAAVVALFVAMRLLPERHVRPTAVLPLAYQPVALPPATAPLRLAGAWTMAAPDRRLGGLSGLVVDGDELLAVSDLGAVARFDPPTSLRPRVILSDLRQGPGDAGKKRSRDAESIVRDPRGRGWWVGYEQRHSLWLYDPAMARAIAAIRLPKLGWRSNRGAEALLASNGELVALGENGRHGVRIGSSGPRLAKLDANADIADATTAPDGSLWVLLRSKGMDGIRQAIAPLRETRGGYRVGRRLELPRSAFDNFEGLAISELGGGRWRIWLVSDDGHRFMARTLLVALDLETAATHDKGPARRTGPSEPTIGSP